MYGSWGRTGKEKFPIAICPDSLHHGDTALLTVTAHDAPAVLGPDGVSMSNARETRAQSMLLVLKYTAPRYDSLST
jgi:hypothetical protein